MKIHLLSGFLGSGKTTAIQLACNELMLINRKAGVIANDQGIKLVDRNFFESLNIPNRQVINGCFCCNYNDLDNNIHSLINTHQPDVIFAESVGSCTDIVATVMKPLQQFYPDMEVTVSTFADVRLLLMLLKNNSPFFDESVNYIYYKQLEEAGIIVINKTDLLTADQLEEAKQIMNERYKDKILLYQNSLNAGSVRHWLQILDNYQPGIKLPSLQIDYDIYGKGEAKLAWLDQEIEIYSPENKATQIAVKLINDIYNHILRHNYSIGHLKFLLDDKEKQTKISFTAITQPTAIYEAENVQAGSVALLINARVQTEPEKLSAIVSDLIKETESEWDCKIITASLSAFQPGYPRPTHRIANPLPGSR